VAQSQGEWRVIWSELLPLAALLAATGALVGILAGLFGVGGGTITVPVLFYVFGYLGIDESVAMPAAVGTSLALIVPTSIKSARGHLAKGAVDVPLLKQWIATVTAGVVIGAVIARFADPWVFQVVFVMVASANAIKLIFGGDKWTIAPTMPGGVLSLVYGWVVGLTSALMGIGGGAIANLIFTLHGKPIHQAVGTSAALGVLISIPGALGYMWAGWAKAGLPTGSVGYVCLIAVLLMLPTTLMTTGLGVKIAHALKKRHLELAFGVYLAVVSLRFVFKLLGVF
jgi:uncharacterized protein